MDSIKNTIEHFTQELEAIRTGRATPALVENIAVECYGSKQPLKAVASISAPEPSLLVLEVWDPSIAKDVERALLQADLGMSPSAEGAVLRLRLPVLTEERRKEFIKLAKQKLEQAKLRLRTFREETMHELRKKEKEGELSEDMRTIEEKKLQKEIDEAQIVLLELFDKKEKELLTV